MNSALAGSDADQCAVEDEVIVADDRDVGEKTSSEKAYAGAYEVDGGTRVVAEVQTQKPLSEGSPPAGTLGTGEIKPTAKYEKGEAVGNECGSHKSKNFGRSFSGAEVEISLPNAHADGKKRDEARERNSEDEEVDEFSDEAQPESGLAHIGSGRRMGDFR